MKIQSLSRALLLGAFFFPVDYSQASDTQEKNQTQTTATDNSAQRNVFEAKQNSAIEDRVYSIRSISDASNSTWIGQGKYKDAEAYYFIDTEGTFQIARHKNGITFRLAYDAVDKKAGRLFPASKDPTKPVAVIDASDALGINADFLIYDFGDQYDVHCQLRPTIKKSNHPDFHSAFTFESMSGDVLVNQPKTYKGGNLFNCTGFTEKSFSIPSNPTRPVAILSKSETGLNEDIKIYSLGNSANAVYPLSSFIQVPSHTQVDSNFLLTVDSALKDLPLGMTNHLGSKGVKFILGGNVEDTYYHHFPSFRNEDNRVTVLSDVAYEGAGDADTKPCKSNAKYYNCPAFFHSFTNNVYMPQKFSAYNSEDIIDKASSDWSDHTRATIAHEASHAFDFNFQHRLSTYSDFTTAHKIDVQRMSPEERKKASYFACFDKEAFAEITSALIGGLDDNRAEIVLKHFPLSSEYIREKILPKMGVNIKVEDVRIIYRGYLNNSLESSIASKN